MITLNVFTQLWEWLDGVFKNLGFDNLIQSFYQGYIAPMHEIFKWLLLLLLIIIVVLGTFSLIKKTFKLIIVIGVIVAAIIFFTRL